MNQTFKRVSVTAGIILTALFMLYLWLIDPFKWEKVDQVTIQWQLGGYGIVTVNALTEKELVKEIHAWVFSPKPGIEHVENSELADPHWVITFQSGSRQVSLIGAANGHAYRRISSSGEADETGWYFRQDSSPIFANLQERFFTCLPEPKKVLPRKAQGEEGRQEVQLASFITHIMMNGQGGVYTNYRDDRPELRDEARNHDILSESTGLLLEYALLTDDLELYRQQVAYVRKYLVSPYGILAWKVSEDNQKPQPASALIDDIRVAATLIQGFHKWQNIRDLELAKSILHAVYRLEQKEGNWRSWFDWTQAPEGWKGWFSELDPNGSSTVPVRYLQPAYIKLVSSVDPRFETFVFHAIEVIKRADFGNGLFATDYSPEVGVFQEKPEVNMVDSLLSALHGAQAGYASPSTVNFLRGELNKGRILAAYRLNPHREPVPSTETQSPAVYALAALFLWQVGEKDLAKVAVDHLLLHRISDPQSIFFGGFGDPRTGDCYSFDNLLALQALAVVGSRR